VTDSRPGNLLHILETPEGYRRFFMDGTLWRPFVERVCRRHDLSCRSIRPGLAGTFPTFIVDEHVVVKFFGQSFKGMRNWQVEKEAAQLMESNPEIPTAHVLASGRPEHATGWRYLVFDYLPGISLGEVYQEVSRTDKLALARWLGASLPQIHTVKVSAKTALPRLTQRMLNAWAARRRGEGWPGWPPHLACQVDNYLAAGGEAMTGLPLHFIHADLTRDHLIGSWKKRTWRVLGIIDFGDAMLGNLYYELAVLHLDLFACDRHMLAAFLQAYPLAAEERRGFIRKVMSVTLMHQFDLIAPLFARKPELRRVSSLETLADRLWNVDGIQPIQARLV
jgi:hygromycin-B 7''-O-kinase